MAAEKTVKREEFPDFLTDQQILDIKQHDAWPIHSFTGHKNNKGAVEDAISGDTLMRIQWEDALWPNDGSKNHQYLRKRLQKEKARNRVLWVDTVLIGDQECTQVRWKESWNKLNSVILECARTRTSNKLRMYCMANSLKYTSLKRQAIQRFSDL